MLDCLDDRCSNCSGVSMALELLSVEARLIDRSPVDFSRQDLKSHRYDIVATCGVVADGATQRDANTTSAEAEGSHEEGA